MKDDKSPSTTVNENAKSKDGQGHTMSGATGGNFNPPNKDMHSSKNLVVPVCTDRAMKKY